MAFIFLLLSFTYLSRTYKRLHFLKARVLGCVRPAGTSGPPLPVVWLAACRQACATTSLRAATGCVPHSHVNHPCCFLLQALGPLSVCIISIALMNIFDW